MQLISSSEVKAISFTQSPFIQRTEKLRKYISLWEVLKQQRLYEE